MPSLADRPVVLITPWRSITPLRSLTPLRSITPRLSVTPRLSSAELYGRRHIDLQLFAGALCRPALFR